MLWFARLSARGSVNARGPMHWFVRCCGLLWLSTRGSVNAELRAGALVCSAYSFWLAERRELGVGASRVASTADGCCSTQYLAPAGATHRSPSCQLLPSALPEPPSLPRTPVHPRGRKSARRRDRGKTRCEPSPRGSARCLELTQSDGCRFEGTSPHATRFWEQLSGAQRQEVLEHIVRVGIVLDPAARAGADEVELLHPGGERAHLGTRAPSLMRCL